MIRIALVLVLLAVAQLASAGIYPVYPTATSVLPAGRITAVRWVDDGTQPLVRNMGTTNVYLYLKELLVDTLAVSIEPSSLSVNIWISPSWRHNGSDYHIRFVCEDPPVTVYTADFTITGMANTFPIYGPTIDDRNKTAPSITYLSDKPFSSTVPSVSTVRPSTSTTSIESSPTAPSLGTLDNPGEHSPLQAQTDAGVAGLRKRPTVDLERLKFRFVFIFWPTLIGITMAL